MWQWADIILLPSSSVGEVGQSPAENASLKELALVIPVLPGMADEVEGFAAELSGPRAADFACSQGRLGVDHESWFLNRSPAGDSVTIYLEAEDVVRVFAGLIASTDSVDVWLKAEVRRLTGIELGSSFAFAIPKQLLRFRR